MREIKFRAWTGDDMVDVSAIIFDEGTKVSPYEPHILDSHNDVHLLKDIELMQYTGLHDKNGVEIYEGDVCVFDIFDTLTRYPDLNPFGSYLVVIEWKHGAWGFRFLYPELVNEDDREWCAFWNSKDGEMWNLKYFRVIGNIHENPELLESPDA